MADEAGKEVNKMAKAQAATAEPETTTEATAAETPMKVVIRDLFEQGKSRSEIAKELGVTYQRVFSLTKGQTNASTSESGARPKVICEGLEGENARFNGVARIEAIRTLFAEGNKVGPIAKALGTTYQIVFQATRSLREAQNAAEAPEDGTEVEDGETADTEDEE
jgi:transposase-like protein